MWRSCIRMIVAIACLIAGDRTRSASPADARPIIPDWSYDLVTLKNGTVLKGLILEETPTQLRFQNIQRRPGRPTVWLTATFPKSEIGKVEKLSATDRDTLRKRIAELDPTGESERRRMEQLELIPTEWEGKPKKALRYDSDYFSLISTAPEEVVRRSVVRLEEVYSAYSRFLAPRITGGKPTTIVLLSRPEDYQRLLADKGTKLENPAFFEPAANRIICGSDLQVFGEELEKIRRQHESLRAELDKYETEAKKLYARKPMELAQHLEVVRMHRRSITQIDQRNDAKFGERTAQLFAMLYHESFHAYVANFVYPAVGNSTMNCPGELPRWLNEGLAQIFETAIVEAGELRVGHIDRNRLARIKEALRKNELLPTKALLQCNPKQFLVIHDGDRPASDRTYLASWALASYLLFERRLMGTPALEEWIRRVQKGENTEEAFAQLVGQKLPDFEKDLHRWLNRLQADGSLLELPKKP